MTLRIEDVTKRFGGVVAVRNVSLELTSTITGLMGPNGSGKSTLFHTVAGAHKPTSGAVFFDGKRISGQPSHKVARGGVVRTFQQRMVFEGLTVRDNIRVAALLAHAEENSDALLEFVGLSAHADATASSLSYGQARTLAVALALAADPKLILLDEPAAGLNHQEAEGLADLLRRVSDTSARTCWVIEHNLQFMMSLVDHLYVMDAGSIIADGSPDEVRGSAIVRQRYLGG